MVELLEIYQLAQKMNNLLKDKRISDIDILQPRCTNLSVREWNRKTRGVLVKEVYHKGIWICIALSNDKTILISLGLGGELSYFTSLGQIKKKHHVCLVVDDEEGFTIKFWCFGKFLLSSNADLEKEISLKDIGEHLWNRRVGLGYIEIPKDKCKVKKDEL